VGPPADPSLEIRAAGRLERELHIAGLDPLKQRLAVELDVRHKPVARHGQEIQ